MRKFWSWRYPRSDDAAQFPAFRVRAAGPVPDADIQVELNGMDITKGLTEFRVRSAVGEPHRVVLTMLAGELEIDLEALEDLQVESSLIRSES